MRTVGNSAIILSHLSTLYHVLPSPLCDLVVPVFHGVPLFLDPCTASCRISLDNVPVCQLSPYIISGVCASGIIPHTQKKE